MRYLLDTNILSHVIRNPQGRAAQKIVEVGDQAVCTSIVVAAELWYGAMKRNSDRLTAQVGAVLGAIDILAIASPVERIYGELRARLEREGNQIGGNDLLIAAQSICLGLTLVTDNEREFLRIVELPCANWLH
ncbi:MAG: type II toxin-antitoxin system VapC family toxin [Candidatus Velthaea sp.]